MQKVFYRIGAMILLVLSITGCGLFSDNTLHVAGVTAAADPYVGQEIAMAGPYLLKTGDKHARQRSRCAATW
ncbi:MAG: hypothetical protein LW717_02920 [Chloroflexaceae bacterium]|nr:hypothetical protein [Chloroflexaceae bacterium]